MKKFRAYIDSIFQFFEQKQILAVIAGIVLTIGIEAFFNGVLQKSAALLVVLVAILVISTIVSLQRISDAIHKGFADPPFIGLAYYGEDEVEEAFVKSIEAIRSAKKRIVVLAGYTAGPGYSPPARMPRTRPSYLGEIEKVVNARLQNPGQGRFLYKRVLQSLEAPYEETLRREQVDDQVFEHSKRLMETLQMPEASDRVEYELSIRGPAISCPTILIVDDTFVALAIIGERNEIVAGKTITVASMRGVVDIYDSTGKAADHYVRVIDNLSRAATIIKAIEA